jgi:hypothetical protein
MWVFTSLRRNGFKGLLDHNSRRSGRVVLTFEKLTRYLPHFKSAIQVPIYVLGIDYDSLERRIRRVTAVLFQEPSSPSADWPAVTGYEEHNDCDKNTDPVFEM